MKNVTINNTVSEQRMKSEGEDALAKQPNKEHGEDTVVEQPLEEDRESVAEQSLEEDGEEIVVEQSNPYTKKNGRRSEENWAFLAKIVDEAQLERVRRIHGLGKWQGNNTTIWLRCTRYSPSMPCPYRGAYVKAEGILYHRGTHCHDKKVKKKLRKLKRSTISEKAAENATTDNTTEQPAKEKDRKDTVAKQQLKYGEDTVAEQSLEENGEGTVAEQSLEEDHESTVVAEQPESRIRKYGGRSDVKWEFLAEVEDEAQLDKIRKIHGLGKWRQSDITMWLRCSRSYSSFPSCPYRGCYVKADRILYHRGVHYHDESVKKKRRKYRGNTVSKKNEGKTAVKKTTMDNAAPMEEDGEDTVADQSLKADGEGTVAEQSMREDGEGTVAEQLIKYNAEDTLAEQPSEDEGEDTVTDQRRSYYIDGLGQKWKLLAKIENAAHFKRLHLSRGLGITNYAKTTIQLYCRSRCNPLIKCPYRAVYLIGPRLLYHRFAHNHPPKTEKKKRNGKRGLKTTIKKKHTSREDQQKDKAEDQTSCGSDQKSGGSDQRSICRKRKAKNPVPGCSHSKKANCQNDPFHDSANKEEKQKEFVIADFEDEFKRVSEQPSLEFLEENGTFALAKMDLATKTVDKMLLFMDMGNSMVEVCKFEGEQFTGQREKWAITEPEQFRHEFHRICAEYLV